MATAKKKPAGKSAATKAAAANNATAVTKAAAAAAAAAAPATEADLAQLVTATQDTYERLREIDEDDLPAARIQEYWRDRYIARAAFERAEIAVFDNLVNQQKAQLPAVTAGNAALARDAQATADAIAVVNLVSASLGIVASVITLLA